MEKTLWCVYWPFSYLSSLLSPCTRFSVLVPSLFCQYAHTYIHAHIHTHTHTHTHIRTHTHTHTHTRTHTHTHAHTQVRWDSKNKRKNDAFVSVSQSSLVLVSVSLVFFLFAPLFAFWIPRRSVELWFLQRVTRSTPDHRCIIPGTNQQKYDNFLGFGGRHVCQTQVSSPGIPYNSHFLRTLLSRPLQTLNNYLVQVSKLTCIECINKFPPTRSSVSMRTCASPWWIRSALLTSCAQARWAKSTLCLLTILPVLYWACKFNCLFDFVCVCVCALSCVSLWWTRSALLTSCAQARWAKRILCWRNPLHFSLCIGTVTFDNLFN
jgi:hypothetical protein